MLPDRRADVSRLVRTEDSEHKDSSAVNGRIV